MTLAILTKEAENFLSSDKAQTFSSTLAFPSIGTFAVETLDALDVVEKNQLYQNVSKCVVNLIAGIARVVAEQDSRNEAANEIPAILPHMLLKLCGKDFAEVLQKQKERLLKRWSEVEIDAIEREFQELKLAYQNEVPGNAVAIPPQKSFKDLNQFGT